LIKNLFYDIFIYMKGELLSFSEYYKNFQKKYYEFVFGKNLINVTFDSVTNIKADGIAIEDDVSLLLNGHDYFDSKISNFETLNVEQLLKNLEYGDLEEINEIIDDFHNIGSVIIDSDFSGIISVQNPIIARMVLFDFSSDNPETIKNSKLFSTYRKTFRIMKNNGVRRILLKPLGIFYPLISLEDSIRILVTAVKSYSFEKIILTVDSKEQAEVVSYHLIELGRAVNE